MTGDMLALAQALGRVEEDETEVLKSLCEAAEQQLLLRRKEGVTREECGTAFDLAGAWLALAGLAEARQAGEDVASFTAGDVTVKTAAAGGGEGPERLRRQAMELMRPFLEGDTFFFQGVKS